MELKVIFWIIIGLVYFFSKLKKKTPTVPNQEEEVYRPLPRTDTESPKPMSFEELLKEIQGAKAEQSKPNPYSVPEPVLTSGKGVDYQDYDDDLKEEEKDLEDANYDYRKQDSIYKTYEDAKNMAFERPSLEESLKLEDTVVKYGQFKDYQQVTSTNFLAEYIKELRDPKGFKKAFIMSEIIQRRF